MEIIATDEFLHWFAEVKRDLAAAKAILHVIDLLEAKGVTLDHPHTSALKNTKHALRELRINYQAYRVVYAFDPRRDAVLIIGGDKTGDDRFYERIIPVAEQIWEQYLQEQRVGEHDKD